MNNMKKVLALLLTVVMVFGMFPVHAVAVDDAAQACQNCGAVDGHKEDCVDYVAPGCAECAQVEGHLGSCSAYVAPATEQAVVYEAEAVAAVAEAAVSAQSKMAGAQVGDKLWIKSGTSVYKSPEDSKGKEVLLPYHIEIVAIEVVGETVWYQFELIDISAIIGSSFLNNYNWIKSEDTTTKNPEATESPSEPGVTEAPKDPVDQNDCNCGENAPENLAHHADSCPRKQYIKTLFEGKTAQEIHAQWANYDEATRSDLLEMLAVYDAAKHAELQKLINGGSEEPDAVEEAYEKLLAAKSQKEYDEIYSKLDDVVKEQFDEDQRENLNNHLDELPQFNVTAGGKEMNIDVTGPIPENCEVDVTLAEDDQISAFNFDEDTDVLMVVDVTIYDENGEARQPDEGKPITISFDVSGLGLKDGDHCAVYHKHGNEEPDVSCHVVVNGRVNYETDKLSPMAIADDYPLYPTKYMSSKFVYWDVAEEIPNSSFPTHRRGTASRVASVRLNNVPVAQGNSAGKNPSAWAMGNSASSLSSYYPGTRLGSENDTRELVITPAPGYYVTRVTVACTASQPAKWNGLVIMSDAYNCGTWRSGNEYQQDFGYDPTGTITVDLPSLAFCHMSNDIDIYIDDGGLLPKPGGKNEYFILIETAPVPSPLFVEYQYGNIVNSITDTTQRNVFTGSATWVTEAKDANNNSLNKGTFAKDTQNTQFKYYYADGLSESQQAQEAAKWKHFAGGISPEAAAAAASAGYVFAGWQATYHTTCYATKNEPANPNNYTYNFGTQHGTTARYEDGSNVPLHTHVKLVAQWEKAPKLTVTKVTVNDTDPNAKFTFNVQLGDTQDSFDLKNGESRSFVAPKGTRYTVTENVNGNYTTTNSGNTVGTLNSDVMVTFTNTRKTANVTVKKLVEGETEDAGFAFSAQLWADSTKNRTIPFPANIGTGITRSSDGLSATFTLNHNGTVTFNNLPVGAVLEVTETDSKTADSTTNDTNPTNNGKTATYSIVAAKTITFTNTYVPKTSSVVVKKEVVDNHNLYNGEKFQFTVRMKDGSDLPNGAKTMPFELAHDEEMPIANVKIGSVLVIEESKYENYSTTNDHGTGRIAEITVVKEGDTVTFTNTVIAYKLTIKKAWTGDAEDPGEEYPVTLLINNSNYNGSAKKNGQLLTIADGVLNMKPDDSYVIEGLPVGTTYSVSENIDDVTPPYGFEFVAPSYQITGEDAATVAPSNKNLTADTTVTITNELIGVYGDLMISKEGILDVDNHENKNDGFRFEEEQSTIYRVQGPGIDMQVAIVGNDYVTIKHVPLGYYTVTELENWSWRYDSDAGIKETTVTAGNTAEVPFVNTRTEKYWLSGDTHCENWWGGSNGTKLVRKDQT